MRSGIPHIALSAAIALVASVPVHALADGSAPPPVHPSQPAGCGESCVDLRALEEQHAQILSRLRMLDGEIRSVGVKGPIAALVISGGLLLGLTFLMTEIPKQYASIAPAMAAPVAGIVTSAVLLRTRLRRRKPLSLQRARLQDRKAYLESQLTWLEHNGHRQASISEKELRLEISRLETEIAVLETEVARHRLGGPTTGIAVGTLGTLSLGLSGFLIWFLNSEVNEYPEDDYGTREKRLVYVLSGGAAATSAALGFAVSRFRAKRRKRAELGRALHKLGQERRKLEAQLAPEFVSTSVGFQLSATF